MCSLLSRQRQYGEERTEDSTMMTTPLILFARASSPHFFQYVAESHSSPSIMVEPWEKKWTGGSSNVAISGLPTEESKLLMARYY